MDILFGLVILTLIFTVFGITSCAFIGVGYLITMILPFNLFQATSLTVGASFVLVLAMSMIFVGQMVYRTIHPRVVPNYKDEEDNDNG